MLYRCFLSMLLLGVSGCVSAPRVVELASPDPLAPIITPPLTVPPVVTPPLAVPLTKQAYEEAAEYTVQWVQRRPDGTVANFGVDSHLGLINAADAYARGATGEGTRLLVVDTGLNFNHVEFAGKSVKQRISDTADPTYDPSADMWADASHGTFVSSVAVGARTGTDTGGMHGVAFDADVTLLAIQLGTAPPGRDYEAFDLANASDRLGPGLAAAQQEYYDVAAEEGATVINYSFGFAGAVSLARYTKAVFEQKLTPWRTVLAQAGTPDADKFLYVAAAGNEGGVAADVPAGVPFAFDSPTWDASLPLHFEELRATWLVVVALEQDGTIASYSNRCGLSQVFCIAAPGTLLFAADASDANRYRLSSGTSFAAPVVAGALLLLQQYYPMLGNTELVTRVLRTADKTDYSAAGGPNYSNQNIYGQGLLDLDAATRPLGPTSMSAGPEFGAPRYASELSALTGTAAFGDALARGLRGREVALFDTLDAPFLASLDSFVAAPSAHYTLGERVAHLAAETQEIILPHKNQTIYLREEGGTAHPDSTSIAFRQDFKQGELFVGIRANPAWHFGLSGAGVVGAADFSQPNAASAPALALVQGGISFGGALRVAPNQNVRLAFYEGVSPEGASPEGAPDDTSARAYGLLGEYSLRNPRAGLSLQAGWLHETARALGASGEGAFSGLSADTWLSGATAHLRLGAHWTGFAAAHAALSVPRLQHEGRVLHALSPFWSSSFSLGVAGNNLWHPRDRLTLKLAQPQRVESGTAQLRWASGRTRYRELILEETSLALTPSARQLDIELAYARPLTLGNIRAAILVSQNPAHTSTRDSELNLLAQYQLKF